MTWSQRSEEVRQRNFFEIDGSEAMREVYWQMTKVNADCNVLITGPTGTGKTRAARIMHEIAFGASSKKPLLEVNLAALPEELITSELFGHERGSFSGAMQKRVGRFEEANGSSLLIDEIGEIPSGVQVKMLSALDKPRRIERVGSNDPLHPKLLVICATTQNLAQLAFDKKFHNPLYQRLCQKRIHMPSLQERGPDYIRQLVPTLVRREVENQGTPEQALEIDEAVLQELASMSYPGNLRDLDFLVCEMCNEAYACEASRIEMEHLHVAIALRGRDIQEFDISQNVLESTSNQPFGLKESLDVERKETILPVLLEHNGNQLKTANALHINRNTLRHYLRAWKILPLDGCSLQELCTRAQTALQK